ncbi:MAG: hypothetical protein Tsb0034_12240 [Ekhidna sp.]
MKNSLALAICFFCFQLAAQYNDYGPSQDYPFGRPNPDAPTQITEYSPLIGTCSCVSIAKKNQTEWTDTVRMKWVFKYIMNGMAVQDETFKEDGSYSGSIRQYSTDSSKWYVHYYTSKSPVSSLPTWRGGKRDNGNIVLYNEQTTPNGAVGFYRITFSDISTAGFNWTGEWVDKTESFSFPMWKIFCRKDE